MLFYQTVVDGWTVRCYHRILALVSTGFEPGLVTVALELWQSDCRQTKPTRWGSVRLRVETTRVSVHARHPYTSKRTQLSDRFFTQRVVGHLNTATSNPDLASPVSASLFSSVSFNNVFRLAGKVHLCPSSFLVSR
jgi:hypothetical protein